MARTKIIPGVLVMGWHSAPVKDENDKVIGTAYFLELVKAMSFNGNELSIDKTDAFIKPETELWKPLENVGENEIMVADIIRTHKGNRVQSWQKLPDETQKLVRNQEGVEKLLRSFNTI